MATKKVTCSIDGCERMMAVRKWGLCRFHYATRRGQSCKVDGCINPALAAGLCRLHYHRNNRTGETGGLDSLRRPPRPCKVDGCLNLSVVRADLCATHYRRKRLYGTELGTFTTHKKCVICGESAMHGTRSSDHCETHYIDWVIDLHLQGKEPGRRTKDGYIYVTAKRRRYLVHRRVMERQIGRPLYPFEEVHHRNGRRDDNHLSNLELWVKSQPAGQRVTDLVAWVIEFYPAQVAVALAAK